MAKELQMNPQIRDAWVEALLSKKYRQVKGNLRAPLPGKHVGYCCLGVLCDVLKNNPELNINPKNGKKIIDGDWEPDGVIDGNECGLNAKVLKATGLDPIVHGMLISMNDMGGCTFEQIANVIEDRS